MKNILKKQCGYTLIWVLLIVVLIGILTPPLVSKVLSSKLQVQKTEKEIQLENVRHMGITYMESVINLANDQLVEKSDSLLDSKQYRENLQQKIIEIDSGFSHEVVKVLKENGHQFCLEITDIKVREEGDEVVIKYVVKASVNGSAEPKVSDEDVVIHIVKE